MAKKYAPLISVDPIEDQESLTPPRRKAGRPPKRPANPVISDVSPEQFVQELLRAIDRMGGCQNVANALGVDIRYIFRWKKGQGPAKSNMPELIDKLQTMERE